jgi:hypothetical protein
MSASPSHDSGGRRPGHHADPEEIVGKALSEGGRRAKVVITTKGGLDRNNGQPFRDASRGRIMKEIDDGGRTRNSDPRASRSISGRRGRPLRAGELWATRRTSRPARTRRSVAIRGRDHPHRRPR